MTTNRYTHAEQSCSEGLTSLREHVYEFRKRRDRAAGVGVGGGGQGKEGG
jgi:hypothetical protein